MDDPAPNSEDDIRELVKKAQAGDSDALEELFRIHEPSLTGFVRLRAATIVRARESCSDLTQTILREVLQSLPKFEYRGPDSFRKWVFTLAANKLTYRLRYYLAEKRTRRREVLLDDSPDEIAAAAQTYKRIHRPSEIATARETLERMERAFVELPPEQQEVILHARISELPHAEIAEIMGRSEVATRQLLHRALIRLSSLLAEWDRL